MTLLHADNLHKTYRLGRVSVPVLRGAALRVERGEWLALLGASGSGKSTLLHILGGLDRPDRPPPGTPAPRLDVLGRDLASLSPRALDQYRRGDVGFVFQFYHLLPELNVLENVLVGAMVRHGRFSWRRAAPDVRAHALDLLGLFGLAERLGHRPAELSGGERQRVAIARALINRPPLLLADEPTGNLDRQTGNRILDLLAQLRQDQDQTMITVTHDPEVAARADRVLRMEDGQVVPQERQGARATA